MERIGFTGTRSPSEKLRRRAEQLVAGLPLDSIIITGGCVGIDAIVARTAFVNGMHVHTILPADRSRVDSDWRQWATSYDEMPPGSDYRARNERIVSESVRMYAFPETAEDDPRSRRSGTWMTVRIARRQGVPIEVETI